MVSSKKFMSILYTQDIGDGWWEGHVEGKDDEVGLFPASYVEVCGMWGDYVLVSE